MVMGDKIVRDFLSRAAKPSRNSTGKLVLDLPGLLEPYARR